MESIVLQATRRDTQKSARQMRREGFIPAVLYGRGSDSIPLTVNTKAFVRQLTTGAGRNAIFSLTLSTAGGAENYLAMVKEIQKNGMTGEPIHADFQRISLKEKVRANVPVVATGDARGVKEGGILDHQLREVEVECLPAAIPEHIAVDISGLGIGGQIFVRDLPVSGDIKVLSDPDTVVLSVDAPAVEAEPAAEAGAEPELVGKEAKEE